jgi:SAM-dependent methyltransferase
MNSMGDLTRALREAQSGTVARLLLADILQLAEREGIIERIHRLSPFSWEGLCRFLQSDLGYALEKGNRQRMIWLLLRLLCECGWVREEDGVWRWSPGGPPPIPRSDGGTTPAAGSLLDEDQYFFFKRCLQSVPAYLRGGNPSVLFDETNSKAWEMFLGCAEFRICRSLLLELMGIERHPSFRVLDLCYGPGWDLEAAISQFPVIPITALDFTEVFYDKARARAENAQDRNRQLGHPIAPIAWVGPDQWKGFGRPLPFPDGSFEAVLFTCGDPYIPRGLRGEVYCEIGRVLAPDGRLGVLTRCCPDAGARHVPSFWLRISALAHDFAESVCEGWEGFSDAVDTIRTFSDAGFEGAVSLLGTMSLLDSSLWVLKKRRSNE